MIADMKEFLNHNIIHYKGFTLTPLSILVVVGIVLSTAALLKVFKRIIFKRLASSDLGRRNSLYQMLKYIFWVVAILIALQSVGINLSILMAGSAALLVGIGFGLQNIFNDFSSGIFILLEGTISVGDVIDANGIVGEVKEIRLRTTKIITRDDTVLIVPNHKFIAEPVLNWSENDLNTRFSIDVGVAYGSDVQLVKKCLLKVVHDNPKISTHPAPLVRFSDFGDSSLDFELLFWTTSIFQVKDIQSNLRFAIDKIFRENQIQIPFPQRDIHIKSKI